MEGDGALKFSGEVELRLKKGVLFGVLTGRDGVIESDFADPGGRVGEECAETISPIGGAIRGIPGVDPECREDPGGILAGEVKDPAPIGFAGGTAEQALDIGGQGALEDGVAVRGQARILKVTVGIVEGHQAGIESQTGSEFKAENKKMGLPPGSVPTKIRY